MADASQLIASAINNLMTAEELLKAQPPAPRPPAPPSPKPPPVKLVRLQKWLGTNRLGVYFGIETNNWRAPDFHAAALKLRSWGVDYAAVKFGEWGIEWYDRTAPDIMAAFHAAGMGLVPFYFCRPQTWQADADICQHLANMAGGVKLDCEEQFINHGTELAGIVNTVRAKAPGACILVSGYGDPLTAFSDGRGGTAWSFDAIANADAYEPQTYLTYWDIYHRSGWAAGCDWSMQQCAKAFVQRGLGLSYPIAPCISTPLNAGDYTPVARYFRKWNAGLCLWEYQTVTKEIVAACKAGLA